MTEKPKVGDKVRFRRDIIEADFHRGDRRLAKKGEIGKIVEVRTNGGVFADDPMYRIQIDNRDPWIADIVLDKWEFKVVEPHPLIQLAKAADTEETEDARDD